MGTYTPKLAKRMNILYRACDTVLSLFDPAPIFKVRSYAPDNVTFELRLDQSVDNIIYYVSLTSHSNFLNAIVTKYVNDTMVEKHVLDSCEKYVTEHRYIEQLKICITEMNQ